MTGGGRSCPDVADWRAGDMAVFVKLHDDTAAWVRCKDGGPVHVYSVEGKERPCVILDRGPRGYFRVWCTTGWPKPEPRHIEVTDVAGLRNQSYVRADPRDVRWVHANLARRWIGPQDPLAFQALMDELDRMTLGRGR